MNKEAALSTLVQCAVGMLGLLLVFLPVFLQYIRESRDSEGNRGTRANQRDLKSLAYAVIFIMGVVALDATLGMLALWDAPSHVGYAAGVVFLALPWLIVALAWVALKKGL
jgi:hypothetical protein